MIILQLMAITAIAFVLCGLAKKIDGVFIILLISMVIGGYNLNTFINEKDKVKVSNPITSIKSGNE